METADVSVWDYVIFGIILIWSLAIGIYYGCFGSKQKSTKEYLMASRSMPAWPVAVSMVMLHMQRHLNVCSAVSAITLLANPVEVYLYGTGYSMVMLTFIPFNISLAYFYYPVYFNLNVSSAYEVTSMAIAVYAPSLAIKQLTGIDTKISTFVIYFVCIVYSSLGGLRGVLWTDVLQTTIMVVSLAVISIKGVLDVGGIDTVWQRAKEGNRVEFFNFDPDPRTRHTFFTCLIAGYFFWLPSFAATQLQVQRVLSMPTITRARKALAMNLVGLIIIVGFCFFTGVVVYAMFYDCDPITSGIVEKSDQLVPLFAARVSNGIPGVLGLFISSLTCASMTSLSSGLNALASISTIDFVSKLFPNLSDLKLSLISKISTFAFGMVSYAFVFAVENMGSILPATSSLLGIMLGPTLGIFSLGMMFPWANSKGSLLGMISAFILMIAYVIGNLSAEGLPDQRLFLDTSNCELENTTYATFDTSTNWKDKEYSGMTKLLSASYMWYSGMGCVLCVFFGLLFSVAINQWEKGQRKLVHSKCISPPIMKLLNKMFPHHIQQWVDQSDTIPKLE
ncbi:Sodium-coupled monocarboxylate transporter 2 [Pseudolycoriella hygida]|uniref:Sodium-coupled monocarboxylate transporter 2 n=1 Tax=Pseudolycoriella hygida TaxID=35572 RepID=A0A9Q0MZT5_9DIPT|nr:Sodium-coupled monocarboxylate transporter 2 [Pseudolycoriella hygida]